MVKYMNKTDEARLNGMQLALKIARERGIEDLEKEINWRCKNNISAPFPRQEFIMAARGLAQKEFRFVAAAMGSTLTKEMNMPPSIVKDFLKHFNNRMDVYRDNEQEYEKDINMLDSDFGMKEMVRQYTEEMEKHE